MYYTLANRPEGKRYGMNFEEMKAKIEDLEKRVEANENHEHGPVF